MTLGELTKWTVLRSWGPRKLADLAEWRHDVVLLPSDEAVAMAWGSCRLGSTTRPVNATWIAACCLVYDLPLATFNVKDFTDFAAYEELRLVDLT